MRAKTRSAQDAARAKNRREDGLITAFRARREEKRKKPGSSGSGGRRKTGEGRRIAGRQGGRRRIADRANFPRKTSLPDCASRRRKSGHPKTRLSREQSGWRRLRNGG